MEPLPTENETGSTLSQNVQPIPDAGGTNNELSSFLSTGPQADCLSLDLCKLNQHNYQVLSRIMRDKPAIQVSSTRSGREFSKAGSVMSHD